MASPCAAGGPFAAPSCPVKEKKTGSDVRKKMQTRWVRVKILSGLVVRITLLRGDGFQ